MKKINILHKQAMDIAEQALLIQIKGDYEESIRLFGEAFNIEREAALTLEISDENEPSRTILFQSAASLALKAENPSEAEKMASYALIGSGPENIKDEIRDLLEQINLERHLKLKGIELAHDEVQLSLAGPEIGFGMAKTDEFIKRIEIIEKMAIRTAERQQGLPFREKGKPPKYIKETYEPYFSIPRAASFAVTIKFGYATKNYLLFEQDPIQNMINDFIENIDLINNKKESELEEKIKNEKYFNNFIALTKKLSPDLKNVNLVGFTTTRDNKENYANLIRTSKDIKIKNIIEEDDTTEGELRTITGKLDFASAAKHEVQLTDEDGSKYTVIVPHEILSDIVKPYWEDIVEITGRTYGNKIYFEDINLPD